MAKAKAKAKGKKTNCFQIPILFFSILLCSFPCLCMHVCVRVGFVRFFVLLNWKMCLLLDSLQQQQNSINSTLILIRQHFFFFTYCCCYFSRFAFISVGSVEWNFVFVAWIEFCSSVLCFIPFAMAVFLFILFLLFNFNPIILTDVCFSLCADFHFNSCSHSSSHSHSWLSIPAAALPLLSFV